MDFNNTLILERISTFELFGSFKGKWVKIHTGRNNGKYQVITTGKNPLSPVKIKTITEAINKSKDLVNAKYVKQI